jgi:broad specificity phosphatase PhoE
MKIYFVRHGESTANLLREFSNRGTKHPLTAKGIEQARMVANNISSVQFECIYSSPILRAIQTSQIISESIHAPIHITEALREWDVGIYEGTTDPVGWELHRRIQDLWFVHQQYDSRMPGGESFNEIHKRFIPLIEVLLSDKNNSDHNFIFVSHGGLYMAMLPTVLKNVEFEFVRKHGFPHTGCVIAETRPEGLSCLSWCGIRVNT